MQDFDEAYERQYPVLERAAARLRALLRDVAASIGDRKLVRAKIESVRIKKLPSLRRKARKLVWDAETALHTCSDLVGGRVVCNNVEDVYRFAELIREQLSIDAGPVTRQDYIKNPTSDGYRALHLNFRLNASDGFGFAYVACEVQIRSRLQDSWAELSHGDICKQDKLPQDLRDRAKDLSCLLATADEIATDIRARVARETEPPKARPRLDRVSVEGLAYVFKDVFGRAPPDYVVTEALNRADELGVSVVPLPFALYRIDRS